MATSVSVKRNDRKSRAWGFIYYPESPDDLTFFEQIESTHIPCVVSPLHDSDMWTAEDEAKNSEHKAGTLKKAHFHAMWVFDGPARLSQAQKLCEVFGDHCTKMIQPIGSISAMTRYFAHLDNPQKHQYDPANIVGLNGAQVTLQRALTPEETTQVVREIVAWCRERRCVEYADLLEFSLAHNPDWAQVVMSRTIMINAYLRSLRHSIRPVFPKRDQGQRDAEKIDSRADSVAPEGMSHATAGEGTQRTRRTAAAAAEQRPRDPRPASPEMSHSGSDSADEFGEVEF